MTRQCRYEIIVFSLDKLIVIGLITSREYKRARKNAKAKYNPIIRH